MKKLVFALLAGAACLMTIGSQQKAIADPPVMCFMFGCPDWCVNQDTSCRNWPNLPSLRKSVAPGMHRKG